MRRSLRLRLRPTNAHTRPSPDLGGELLERVSELERLLKQKGDEIGKLQERKRHNVSFVKQLKFAGSYLSDKLAKANEELAALRQEDEYDSSQYEPTADDLASIMAALSI